MTAKEYLMQVRFIDRLIDSKLEQAAQLKATATKATATLSDMPRSDSPDLQSMETNIIKMIDLEREINRDVDRLVDLKKEAREVINQLTAADQRLILELRYLCFKTWPDIAVDLGYSESNVYRLHARSLERLAELPAKALMAGHEPGKLPSDALSLLRECVSDVLSGKKTGIYTQTFAGSGMELTKNGIGLIYNPAHLHD